MMGILTFDAGCAGAVYAIMEDVQESGYGGSFTPSTIFSSRSPDFTSFLHPDGRRYSPEISAHSSRCIAPWKNRPRLRENLR